MENACRYFYISRAFNLVSVVLMEKYLLFLLFATILVSGLFGFIAKVGISKVGVYQYLLVVNFFAVVVVFAYLAVTHNMVLELSKDLVYPILAGIFIGVGSITFHLLVKDAKISVVMPLTALYPVITVVLAVLILKEQLSVYQGAGIFLALVAGVLLAM